jgi:tyrosyl-tRNA synthetase
VDLFDDLRWRGLAYQWTGEDDLPGRLRTGPVTVYCGFDPSADSLHVGSLVPLTMLRRFQRAGHRPIAVAGGATGMIGDPSGKSEERNLLTREEVDSNVEAIRPQIARFLDLETGENQGLLVNNADWLERWSYIDFLRDVGKHFSMNVLLGRESIKARLESEAGISYTEFSYSLLQAYDFLQLHGEHGCELQIGGSDQFGNIVAGIDLARRMSGAQLYGLTMPLITDSSGQKFGKTVTGTAAWLSPERTSPYAFYQFFLNTGDADVGRYLRVFTEVPHDEILALEGSTTSHPERREAQRRLAREMTVLVHGSDGLARAERATQALFGGGLEGLGEEDLLEIFAEVPSVELPRSRLNAGLSAGDAFVAAGLARSKSEAARLVGSGGAYVNGRRLDGTDEALTTRDLATETVMVLRTGKRSYALLRFPR